MKLSEGGTLLLVIIGWAATHFFSEARERRKEVRTRIDAAYKSLRDLQLAAEKFHTADFHDTVEARKLTAEIHWFQRSLSRISILDEDDLAPFIIALRRAITLRNFDASGFVKQNEQSDVLTGIVDAVADLEDELERQYVRQYPVSFPYFRFAPLRAIAKRVREK